MWFLCTFLLYSDDDGEGFWLLFNGLCVFCQIKPGLFEMHTGHLVSWFEYDLKVCVRKLKQIEGVFVPQHRCFSQTVIIVPDVPLSMNT